MSKYIFFDIDGTLTSEKLQGKISPSTKATLEKLVDNGHFVAITTGRAHFRAQQFADAEGISHLVCEGGNGVCINGEMIHYESMDQEALIRICEEAQAKGIGFALSNEDTRIRYAINTLFHEQAQDYEDFMEVRVQPDFDYHHCGTIRRVFLSLSKEDEKRMTSIQGMGYMRYNDHFLIVEPDHKYHGIQMMMKLIHGSEEDVVVFGDGYNDRSMFQLAPLKVAMGNAIEELKDMADYVTDSCDNDGIEKACRHFGWI